MISDVQKKCYRCVIKEGRNAGSGAQHANLLAVKAVTAVRLIKDLKVVLKKKANEEGYVAFLLFYVNLNVNATTLYETH